jgi:hypothetical protein
MTGSRRFVLITLAVAGWVSTSGAQTSWNAAAIESETLQHFQALLRLDQQPAWKRDSSRRVSRTGSQT